MTLAMAFDIIAVGLNDNRHSGMDIATNDLVCSFIIIVVVTSKFKNRTSCRKRFHNKTASKSQSLNQRTMDSRQQKSVNKPSLCFYDHSVIYFSISLCLFLILKRSIFLLSRTALHLTFVKRNWILQVRERVSDLKILLKVSCLKLKDFFYWWFPFFFSRFLESFPLFFRLLFLLHSASFSQFFNSIAKKIFSEK